MERIRLRDNWIIAEEDKVQRNEARKRAIRSGKVGDNALNLAVRKIMSLAEAKPEEISLKNALELARLARELQRDHREMFALTAAEQARDDNDNARIDLEYDKLIAAQPAPIEEESGSNFIEALNANVADFFPNAGEMIQPAEGGGTVDDTNNGTT